MREWLFRPSGTGTWPPGEPPPSGRRIPPCARRLSGDGSPRSRRLMRGSRLMLASGIPLMLAVLVVCMLSLPGFVLGAEEDPASSPGGLIEERPATSAVLNAQVENEGPEDTAAPFPSEGALLVTLPWGEGDGQVGLAQPGEGLSRGPEAVAVAGDGRIVVLDAVNHRLLLLGAQGAFTAGVAVPLAEPRFLAVDDEHIYVLDCDRDRRLLKLSWSGRILEQVELPMLDDVVTGLFATERGPCLEVAHERSLLVTRLTSRSAKAVSIPAIPGRPLDKSLKRTVQATFSAARGLRLGVSAVDSRTLRVAPGQTLSPLLAPGRAIEHLVSVDGDGSGGMIVGARLLLDGSSSGREPALLLSRFGAVGDLGGAAVDRAPAVEPSASLLLKDCSFTYLGQPYTVAPDGRVIQPMADEGGYSLLVHTFVQAEEVQR